MPSILVIIVNIIKNTLLFRHLRIVVLGRPIRTWFYREDSFLNFGDELTPDIIQKLFHRRFVRTSIEDADLFAVGSIIEVVDHPRSKKSYVWGSGFIRQGGLIENNQLIFRAIRGNISLSRISKKYKSIAVGDPGLLSSLIYERSSHKTEKIGIIPHYVDESDPLLDIAKQQPDTYQIISVKDTPEEVSKKITECRVILSSSLHGLIVSDSFGIPNVHMPMSNKVAGGGYKFKDYYSSINKQYVFFDKNDLYNNDKIDIIAESYVPVVNLEGIQSRLIRAFPYR